MRGDLYEQLRFSLAVLMHRTTSANVCAVFGTLAVLLLDYVQHTLVLHYMYRIMHINVEQAPH